MQRVYLSNLGRRGVGNRERYRLEMRWNGRKEGERRLEEESLDGKREGTVCMREPRTENRNPGKGKTKRQVEKYRDVVDISSSRWRGREEAKEERRKGESERERGEDWLIIMIIETKKKKKKKIIK